MGHCAHCAAMAHTFLLCSCLLALAVLIHGRPQNPDRSVSFSRMLLEKRLGLMRKSLASSSVRQSVEECPSAASLTATNAVQTLTMGAYSNYMDCSWTIQAEPGMVVYIHLPHYDIEDSWNCVYDYLIVDGLKLCGGGTYEGFSQGTSTQIAFHSDCSINGAGFTIEYSQIPADQVPPQTDMANGQTLALTADVSEILIHSQSGSSYSNNMDVTTTITAPTGMMVRLTVQAFDLEYACQCQYDSVQILDSSNNLVQEWCGSVAAGTQTMTLELMKIIFHTDYSVTASGFVFEISIGDPASLAPYQLPGYEAQACPGPLVIDDFTSPRQVASPHWGMGSYSNNMECSWKIIAPAGMYVKVHFTSMDIEHHGQCEYDSVTFLDGDFGPEITSLCGSILPPDFTSNTPVMVIRFSTDYSVIAPGFMLEVTAVDTPSIPVSACGTFRPLPIVTEGTVITSPTGATDTYPSDSQCGWLITAPEGEVVILTMNSFHLEDAPGCMYDALTVYEGNAPDHDSEIAVLCGTTTPNLEFTSGNEMFVEFTSDYCIEYEGFSATVTFGQPPEGVNTDDWKPPTDDGWGSDWWYSSYSDFWSPGSGSPPAPVDYPQTIGGTIAEEGECGSPAVASTTLSTDPALRIVGGNEATPNSWPWQISLRWCPGCSLNNVGGHICGGVIISEHWVLTAAHCVVDAMYNVSPASYYQIVAGDHDQSSWDGREQTRGIEQIIVHQAYLTSDDGRDAALLKLSAPLVLSDYVSPICLTDVEVPVGTDCVATGWGETENPAESNLVLREVLLPIISQAECTNSYGSWITPYTVCAGYMSGGRDTCQGDSGGPLVCEINGSWQLHGLTSFGFGCAEVDYPGVYTRMSELIAWVTAFTDGPADFYLAPGSAPSSPVMDYSSSPDFRANEGDLHEPRPEIPVKMVDWTKHVEKETTEEMELSSRKRTLAELTKKGAQATKLMKYLQQ